MTTHPIDDEGRIIPDASWPPGREAPGQLERVRRFLNTINRENGADHLGESVRAARWLAGDGFAVRPDGGELVELRRFRDELHAAVHALNKGHLPNWPAATSVSHLGLRATADGLHVVGVGFGTDRVISELLAIVLEAGLVGTLRRLRVCAHCHWSYYDRSRNATGQWCSMHACGQREKMRRYRARQRASRFSR